MMFSDKPYSCMKPGQKSMDRQYYVEANQEVASGKTMLSNYHRFKSNYDENTNQVVKKGDYKVPNKSQNNMSK
jgi:hypothetical protein